eukprot:TRINITY_DN23442_c0_g1_i1.p2 TRINITY_DN23442_c0_g1~~TRINITY_DN23442_c0_g1_i1.p2  ORF type:complete len:274 (+),score=35.97 TRINITY_DN23442_c0_g1_i1:55-876(+)
MSQSIAVAAASAVGVVLAVVGASLMLKQTTSYYNDLPDCPKVSREFTCRKPGSPLGSVLGKTSDSLPGDVTWYLTHFVYMVAALGLCIIPSASFFNMLVPLPRKGRKAMHMIFHIGGVILIILGFVAMHKFKVASKNKEPGSTHGALGFFLFALFLLQLLMGLVSFTLPLCGVNIPPVNIRAFMAPVHRATGLAILVLIPGVVISGAVFAEMVYPAGASTFTSKSWQAGAILIALASAIVSAALFSAPRGDPADGADGDHDTTPLLSAGWDQR